MIHRDEPFYQSIAGPVVILGIARGIAFPLMVPGVVWVAAGMFRLNIGWMVGGLALVATLLLPVAWFSRNNPYFLSDLLVSLVDPKHFTAEPGLRGKDGV